MLEEERSRHNCRKLGMRLAGELLLAPAPPPCLHLAPACTFNAVFSCTSTFFHLHFYALLTLKYPNHLKYLYKRIAPLLQPAPTNPKKTGQDFACTSDLEKEHWKAAQVWNKRETEASEVTVFELRPNNPNKNNNDNQRECIFYAFMLFYWSSVGLDFFFLIDLVEDKLFVHLC